MSLKDTTSIGKMDQRIIIQEPVTVRSDTGASVATWAAKCVMWASVSEFAGTEKNSNDKITAIENTLFTMRYIPNITTKMRISYDGRIYNIRSIQRVQRTKYLIIKTTSHE